MDGIVGGDHREDSSEETMALAMVPGEGSQESPLVNHRPGVWYERAKSDTPSNIHDSPEPQTSSPSTHPERTQSCHHHHHHHPHFPALARKHASSMCTTSASSIVTHGAQTRQFDVHGQPRQPQHDDDDDEHLLQLLHLHARAPKRARLACMVSRDHHDTTTTTNCWLLIPVALASTATHIFLKPMTTASPPPPRPSTQTCPSIYVEPTASPHRPPPPSLPSPPPPSPSTSTQLTTSISTPGHANMPFDVRGEMWSPPPPPPPPPPPSSPRTAARTS
ncbi:hypothetical protein BD410DRAFT_846977 [Rickenella mellea]|uniref:Uncharacterized protein n=1 Tax=Rickenella mellea TaxID=50990 RepID=A0A4Y7PEH5_9AGAM|nr:hypothetical protein BD410DRAFT_846977 [Rickenella mellea]